MRARESDDTRLRHAGGFSVADRFARCWLVAEFLRFSAKAMCLVTHRASPQRCAMTSEEEKAAAARRKRDAYFAELAEEEKRGAKKKPRRGAVANVAKPLAAKASKFQVGLKKTGLALPAKQASTDAARTTEAESSDAPAASTESKPASISATTTITGIPPPPSEPYLAEAEDERRRTIRFAAPAGGGGRATRVQIRLGMRGTVAGPVVEVELPVGVREGDLVEATVPPWTAEDVPPPPPAGRSAAPAPPPPPGIGAPAGEAPPPPPPPHMVMMGGGAAAYGLGGLGGAHVRVGGMGAPMGAPMGAATATPPPAMPPVAALGIERARPPMTLMGGKTVEVPPPPPPPPGR